MDHTPYSPTAALWDTFPSWAAAQTQGRILLAAEPAHLEALRPLQTALQQAGRVCTLCPVAAPRDPQTALGQLLLALTPDTGLIAGLGASPLLDWARLAAHNWGVPCAALLVEPAVCTHATAQVEGTDHPLAPLAGVFVAPERLQAASLWSIRAGYAALLSVQPDPPALALVPGLVRRDPEALITLQNRLLSLCPQRDGQPATPQGQAALTQLTEGQLRSRLAQVCCFVLDMDGTIYLEGQLFPFTKQVLNALADHGKQVVFFTNNSSKCLQDYVERLQGLGIPVGENRIFISSYVLMDFLRRHHPGQTLYVVGTPALRWEFLTHDFLLDDVHPDLVILGFDTTLDYEKLTKACDFIRHGAGYYGVNPDLNCPMAGLEYIPDCGSMARLIQSSTGRYPAFFGKPSRAALDYVMARTGCRAEELCFVGDRLYTDIAIAAGTPAASVLVLTGESTLADIETQGIYPDFVLPSLETLPQYL